MVHDANWLIQTGGIVCLPNFPVPFQRSVLCDRHTEITPHAHSDVHPHASSLELLVSNFPILFLQALTTFGYFPPLVASLST